MGIDAEVGQPWRRVDRYRRRYRCGCRRIAREHRWFEQTLAADKSTVGTIALLRFDGDLYESARVCLEQLYGQVVPGGIVVIDDYFQYQGCRRAVDEFMRQLPPTMLHPVDSNAIYWIKS